MSKNSGKKFEDLVKLACEEQDVDYTRLKDAGFMRAEKSEHKRFTPKNICDAILVSRGTVVFTEMKSRKSALRFDEITQLKDLKKKWLPRKAIISGVLCNLNGTIVFMSVPAILLMESEINKKSFNSSDALAYGMAVETFIPLRKRTARPNIAILIDRLTAKLSKFPPCVA